MSWVFATVVTLIAIVAGGVVGGLATVMLLLLGAPPDPFWWHVWTVVACPLIGFAVATLVLRWTFR